MGGAGIVYGTGTVELKTIYGDNIRIYTYNIKEYIRVKYV